MGAEGQRCPTKGDSKVWGYKAGGRVFVRTWEGKRLQPFPTGRKVSRPPAPWVPQRMGGRHCSPNTPGRGANRRWGGDQAGLVVFGGERKREWPWRVLVMERAEKPAYSKRTLERGQLEGEQTVTRET